MQTKTKRSAKATKGKRGRPRLSDLPDDEQARLRMRRIRERRRRGNLVPVEVWIPKNQRNALLKLGYDLSAAATKAFALLIKRRKPVESTEEVHERPHFTIDLDNPVP